MPFKVTFKIYEPGKKAPNITAFDAKYAKIELRSLQNKMPLARMTVDVEPINLTKEEEYVYLIYRYLKASEKYVADGKKRADLDACKSLAWSIDEQNHKISQQLDHNPELLKQKEGTPGYKFFRDVITWRFCWHNWMDSRKRNDIDKQTKKEVTKEYFEMEDEINRYVKKFIGL
ncbi:hypothetical protein L6472_05980 [Prevotella sp. E13-17]|uniref:hypothetical protein n=1 Tax=Prevotella sp. E13-17 TaxID=2913616 RepID=UPI001EDA40CD|nr:hypothetical protein [Prevotella sp. E13-17]UKK52126.1 hypothetical protein L6472_05980 [Prevotella sp. E13-17]